MKNTEIEWHPYPKEKPKIVDEYIVTINYGYFKATSSAIWKKGRFVDNEEYQNNIGSIIAWAEMPEPYKEES